MFQKNQLQNAIQFSHLIFYLKMGICTSAEKAKQKNQTQTQSKTVTQVNPPTNPSSAIKQESRIPPKVNEIHRKDPNVTPAYIQQSQSYQIYLTQKKNENKKENLSWLSNFETLLMQDNKVGQQKSQKLQGSGGSWKPGSVKINEEIPDNLVVKAFYHSLQPPTDIARNAFPRKSHHEGVDPILERRFNSQSDENSQIVVKKMSVKQEMGLQPCMKVNGFSWEKKVGELSLVC